ncbi:MAG TPA: hypothetical protein VFF73_42420 [Planctomycetota bacterium]|nr:hypothetical protein [Planctomycetota bacterium]
MFPFDFTRVLFLVSCALAFLILGIAAPRGDYFIGTPPIEKVTQDPSIRAGSPHVHHWYTIGGGYHGGK